MPGHRAEKDMPYQVTFYSGEYKQRQLAANRDRCIAYVEQHLNSASKPANYSVVIVASNASQKSRDWGRHYAREVSRQFNTTVGGEDGILVGGYEGRGNANLIDTAMPAILVEPLFANNPAHASILKSQAGRVRLAQILADSIRRFFPKGGSVAFSIGHKGKPGAPSDRGAPVYGGGTEAEFAELILLEAKRMLETAPSPAQYGGLRA
jgi:hypothetical protein